VGQVLAFIMKNMGFITSIVTAIETLAADLQNLHGVPALDAWGHAILAAIESVFSSLGASTTPPAAAAATIGAAKAQLADAASQVQAV
jgi:hypothetical protein